MISVRTLAIWIVSLLYLVSRAKVVINCIYFSNEPSLSSVQYCKNFQSSIYFSVSSTCFGLIHSSPCSSSSGGLRYWFKIFLTQSYIGINFTLTIEFLYFQLSHVFWYIVFLFLFISKSFLIPFWFLLSAIVYLQVFLLNFYIFVHFKKNCLSLLISK